MSNVRKENLLKEVIMYEKDGEEFREFVENEEQKQTIFEEYDNVEILTVQECIEHGIGYPSLEPELLECNTCGIEGYWDEGTGTINGNMFYCEKCNDYVCHKCLEEQGVFNESILCKNCINELGITPSMLISLAEGYNMTELQILNKIKKDEIRIFKDIEHYIDWMYDDNDAKRDFFDDIIYGPINTGDKTVAECLIYGDSRTVSLEDGFIGFLFL